MTFIKPLYTQDASSTESNYVQLVSGTLSPSGSQWQLNISYATGTAVPSGPAGGDITGSYPSPTLAIIGTVAGPFGSATTVPVVSKDDKGRIIAFSSANIDIPQSAVIGLTGSLTAINTSITTLSQSCAGTDNQLGTLIAANTTSITTLSQSCAGTDNQLGASIAANTTSINTLSSSLAYLGALSGNTIPVVQNGVLITTSTLSWDSTRQIATFGPNASPTAFILRTAGSPVPDPVNDGATFIMSAPTYPFMYWKNTAAGANLGMILGLNANEGYFAVRNNWPLKILTNNAIRLTIAAAGVGTFATGLEVSDLTATRPVIATTSGRLATTGSFAFQGNTLHTPDLVVSGTTTLTNLLIVPKTSGAGIKVDKDTPTYPWADIIGPVIPKTTGAGTPTLSLYRGTNLYWFKFVANDVVDYCFHIPHDYAPGTDLYIHVHWSHNGTAITGNAVFDFFSTYAKGHNQAAFPAEKNVTITYATTNIATTPQYQHRIDEVQVSTAGGSATLLDTNAIEPDGLVWGRFKLTTLPTITAGDLFVHTIDLHYQSTGIGTKQKSPNFYT